MKQALGAIAPHYSGEVFTTGVELLSQIKTYLEAQGWEIIIDDIVTSNRLLVKGVSLANASHFCWLDFGLVLDSGIRNLTIKGDLDGSGSFCSPVLKLGYDYGFNNKLWLMADQEAGGICLRNRAGYGGGISFGFLERFDPTDPFAWMVAKANNRLSEAYVAKGKHNQDIWHQISSSYNDADLFFKTSYTGPYQGITDWLVAIPYDNPNILTILNAGYYSHQGRVNGVNGLGLMTRRFYLEGTGNPLAYLPNVQKTGGVFYNRGYIKFFNNGMGELPGGAFFPDDLGNFYLSVGSKNPDGWQGLQIVQQDTATGFTADLSKVIYHGGSSGLAFTKQESFYTEIKNVFKTIGWQILSDTTNINNKNRTLIVAGSYRGSSSEKCYLVVEYQYNINTIKIKAQHRESNNTYDSPYFDFPLTTENKFWLTISSQALALTIETIMPNGDKVPQAIYAGFYSGRIDKNDHYAWGIGAIANDLERFYVAKTYYDNIYWQKISADFNYSNSSRASFFSYGSSDRLTVPLMPNDYYDNENNNANSALYAYLGGINSATNKPQLDFFAVVEGRRARNYGAELDEIGRKLQLPRSLYYRGYIEFVAVGMGRQAPGSIAIAPGVPGSSNIAKFRKVGSSRWQAMQIA